MATEIALITRDDKQGQAFFIRNDEWDLYLSEIRGIFVCQDVNTPADFCFLTTNGNIISKTLENKVTIRDLLYDEETFTEIKKEDVSLDAAEKRACPKVVIVPSASSSSPAEMSNKEIKCPLLKKFPCLQGLEGIIPCTRNSLNFWTAFKTAFLLCCVLIGLEVVLTLFAYTLFGASALRPELLFPWVSSMSPYYSRVQKPTNQQDVLTDIKVNFSKLDVTTKFEIQDLKRKLAELEDLYLNDQVFNKKEMMRMEAKQVAWEKENARNVDFFRGHIDSLYTEVTEVKDQLGRISGPGEGLDIAAAGNHGTGGMAETAESFEEEDEAIGVDGEMETEEGNTDDVEMEEENEEQVSTDVEMVEDEEEVNTDGETEELVMDNKANEKDEEENEEVTQKDLKEKKNESLKMKKDSGKTGKDDKKKNKKNKDEKKKEKKGKDGKKKEKGKKDEKKKEKGKKDEKKKEKGNKNKKNK